MRTTTSRRALTLASALVAAGLTLTAAPHALADGFSTEASTLSTSEAKTLADNMNVDVYGDRYAAKDDTSADTSANGSATDGSSTEATTDASTPVTFTNKSALEGARGIAATVPAGSDGSYFTVHSLGNVQLHKADGSTAWARTNASYYTDWQVKPLQVWRAEPYPASIVMGYNAVNPYSAYSDQGYDTADLTGDGTKDIVFSAAVGMTPTPRPFTSPGSSLSTGTFVTVLDGKTGKTVWSKLYSYATNVKVVDGTLLIGNSPRLNSNAPATETATLTGIRFSYADGKLTPSSTWTYDTKSTASVNWGALESVGGGKVAAVWDLRKTATNTASGRTLVLDAADGSVTWETESALYGRQLRLDASRNRVVALEQADISDAVQYEIAAYDLADGKRTTLDTRVNALPTALTVGDAASGGGDEIAVSESTYTSTYNVNASTIRVLDGADGATVKWTYTTKRSAGNGADGASTWNLATKNGLLYAAAQDDQDQGTATNVGGLRYGSLTAFTSTGKVKWRQHGTNASPMYQQLYSSGGGDYVRVVDQQQNIHDYKLGNGSQKNLTPLQGDLNYGQAADFDGDGKKDVVVGGSSDGVWAYSGTSLVNGAPKKLWQATVPGEVHNIATGDVNGDGTPDVAVAADTATAVIDGKTGKVLTTIDGKGAYVRSVTLADLNDDGKDEVIVPTDALRVYSASGKQLWSYSAPSSAGDVIFSDTVVSGGQIYSQYTSPNALDISDAVVNGVALDGKGNLKWTADPKAPDRAADGKLHGAVLDHGVFASPKIPYADGHAVVYTWIVKADPTVAGDLSTASPRVVVEIRDGRTGELVHQSLNGSPWSHGNYFIDGQGDPLYQMSFGTFRGYAGDGKEDTSSSVVAPLRTVGFINGPGGRRLLAGGLEGGLAAFDPSVLTSGDSFQSSIGGATLIGARNYLAADLDGDGTDEMVSLNFDHLGINRMAEQLGGGVLSIDRGIHQMTTFKLS
ncbi:VCBS repeat-containing protein [Streptomyces sp. SID8379]|uniref:FG-GAP repeat domain-containing protein n=1 Tax=unclassified Streptomyces TaxID=2593676 RepID=UPI0003708FD4|nr:MULTISPECIES: VCBS repeat-containing protein [unclassified Streptomyces]MYW67705.1 VCBS repeat-containing protein [Streptomyces sp. SID8379]